MTDVPEFFLPDEKVVWHERRLGGWTHRYFGVVRHVKDRKCEVEITGIESIDNQPDYEVGALRWVECKYLREAW